MAAGTTTTNIFVQKEMDPPFFRIHFNIPNIIGTLPTKTQQYTNLFGVLKRSQKKIYFSLEDVRDILRIQKEDIEPTFSLKNIVDYPTTTPLIPMIEFNALMDHLEGSLHAN